MSAQQVKWFQRFADLYSAGVSHAYILHFNTNDYVGPDQLYSTPEFLKRSLCKRDVTAVYSRDRGFEFGAESQKQKALEVLGFGQSQDQPDPALQALQALGAAPGSGSSDELPRSPRQALPLIDQLLRARCDVAIIIEDAHLIIPNAPVSQLPPEDRDALALVGRWGRDPEIMATGNIVFLLTPELGALHPDLVASRSRYEALEVPLPDQPQRQEFITYVAEKRNLIRFIDTDQYRGLANATAGLSYLSIEDILLRADLAGALTPEMVRDRKESIIRAEYGSVLEIIEPHFGLGDIGGLEHVKQFFIKNVINPISEGRLSRVPMGVLMTGPAGTGKSIMAEAVAKEAGINAVVLRIGGQIASKWQGEGERNLDRALRAIRSLSPTLVFIDEIDQVISRGDGGNAQNSRIFQRLLEFMSDTSHRGQVVFLAATNRPDLMDAALRRPGRFDKKIPFLVPNAQEREHIFKILSRRYLDVELIQIAPQVIEATEGWTGAEIEAACVKAAEIFEDEEVSMAGALGAAVKRLSPSTADIALMTSLAVSECNDRDLLPTKYRQMLDDRAALEAQIETQKGEVNRGRRNL